MPYYFSGTNARIFMTVGMTFDSIKQIKMWIGGEVVWDESYPDPYVSGIWQLSAGHDLMFDSTQFANGTELEVKFEIWGWGSSHRIKTESAQVVNQAVLYGRYDLEISFLTKNSAGNWVMASGGDEEPYRVLPSSSSRLASMGYDIRKYVTTLGWAAEEFGVDSQDCNVLHVNTHGATTFFWSDTNDYWYEYIFGLPNDYTHITNVYGCSTPQGAPTGSINLLDYRVAANGTGLPPFNSTAKPPINLAYFDCCSAGVTNEFAEATLYPYGNVYAGMYSSENQSSVGYAITVSASQARNVAEAFWQRLEDRYTVTEARYQAYDAYQGGNKPGNATEFMHVWGDFYARLKGVYSGSTGANYNWHT